MTGRGEMKKSVSLVGCGAIGTQLAKALARGSVPGLKLVSLTDLDPERARRLAAGLGSGRTPVLNLDQAVRRCDLLVEAAGAGAVPRIAQAALRAGKELFVLSVGALLDHPEIIRRFGRKKLGLHFPSGAVAGLDGLKAAAAAGGLRQVRLTSRKPPKGLAGAPFFRQKRLDPRDFTRAVRVFAGSAREAIRLFPANVNVAAAVALLGLGPNRTRVEVIVDPAVRRNIHTLEARGAFGQLTARTENLPSRENPKTSALAAASALAALRSLASANRWGT